MTLIAMPLTLLGQIRRRELVSAVARTSSPFSGSQQIQDWGGEWWEYDIKFAKHQSGDGKRMSAFFSQLGAGKNTFLLKDWSMDQTIAGTPVVSGAGQTGNALVTSGWVASSTPMLQGDFFQLGTLELTRLYQLTGDVAANGSGVATLNFVPALRFAPANGQAVIVSQPAVHLRLTAGVPAAIRGGNVFSFVASAREAL